MLFQLVLICFICFILWSLFAGLNRLLCIKRQNPTQVVRALSFRIGFSLLLFVILWLGWFLGWWMPHRLH